MPVSSTLKELFPEHIIPLLDNAHAELEDQDSPRFALMRILVQLGMDNLQTVLPLLEQALSSEDDHLRWTALRELVELGKHHPEQTLQLLEQVMDNQAVITKPDTRILIELGQQDIASVSATFKRAIQSNNADLQWVSLLELIELAAGQPEVVLPLLEEALQSENLHLKWMATLELFELAKLHPQLVTPILTKLLGNEQNLSLAAQDDDEVSYPLCTDHASIEQALSSNDPQRQWAAGIKLIELVTEEPGSTLPLFELALQSDNPDLQWMLMVELVKLVNDYPHIIVPMLKKVLEEDKLNLDFNQIRVLSELGQSDLTQALSLFEKAVQNNNFTLHAAVLLELLELLQFHVQRLIDLLKTETSSKKRKHQLEVIEPQERQVQQITQLIEKILENTNPDLQWSTLHKLLKLNIFMPEKLIAMLDNILQKHTHDYQSQIQKTRVLVELGQKYPALTAPILQQAFTMNNPELHWAAILEMLALIKLSPEIASHFQKQPASVEECIA